VRKKKPLCAFCGAGTTKKDLTLSIEDLNKRTQTTPDKDPLPTWKCSAEGCKSTKTIVTNWDPMWRDGDVVCASCGVFVRSFDT
jgi:hypothetical protein